MARFYVEKTVSGSYFWQFQELIRSKVNANLEFLHNLRRILISTVTKMIIVKAEFVCQHGEIFERVYVIMYNCTIKRTYEI